jgi:hypothetical protein
LLQTGILFAWRLGFRHASSQPCSFSNSLKLKQSPYKVALTPLPDLTLNLNLQLAKHCPHVSAHLRRSILLNNNYKQSPWVSCGLKVSADVTLVSSCSRMGSLQCTNPPRRWCCRRQAWRAPRSLPLQLRPFQLLPLERKRQPNDMTAPYVQTKSRVSSCSDGHQALTFDVSFYRTFYNTLWRRRLGGTQHAL